MRKSVKVLSLIISIIFCFSLCGCINLDDFRDIRASITKEGTIKLYDGSEYKLLPECEELVPDFFSSDEVVFVVEEEVPLLLTFISEASFSKSADGLFLQDDSVDSLVYYCRTDVYDSVLRRIQNGFSPELCGYYYFDFDSEKECFYSLTEAEAAAVNEVYKTVTPEKVPEAAELSYDYTASLCLSSKDKLFMKDFVNVSVLEGKYYLVNYDLNLTTIYNVPKKFEKVFESILKKQIESDKYLEEVW